MIVHDLRFGSQETRGPGRQNSYPMAEEETELLQEEVDPLLDTGITATILTIFTIFRAHNPAVYLAAVTFVPMIAAILVATTLGLLLPFLFRKLGIDPAISSGPLVTTANDSISVAICMTLAVLLAE